MSKVRINDLASELEVKSRAILDVLPELGVPAGKTHSSSLERTRRRRFVRTLRGRQRPHRMRAARTLATARTHCSQDRSLAHLQARRCAEGHPGQEEGRRRRGAPRRACRQSRLRLRRRNLLRQPSLQLVSPRSRAAAAPARQNRARLFRSRAQRRHYRPAAATPAIASRPPAGAVVAKPPQGPFAARPVVVVAPPPAGVVVSRPQLRLHAKKRSPVKARSSRPLHRC